MKTGSLTALAVLAIGLLIGCGKTAEPVKTDPAPEATKNATPDSPEAAIARVTEGLEANRPQVLWESLPLSWQDEVNAIVRASAMRVDEEVWDRSVAVVRRTVALLKAKKEMLLQEPTLNELPGVSDDYDSIVAIAETLTGSDLLQLDRLKQFDGRKFLATTGAKLLGQISQMLEKKGEESLSTRLKKQFQGMKTTLVKQEGDTAVLRIETGDPEVPAEEREYVRIEGKWVPRAVADGWKEGIASFRGRIEAFAGAAASPKQQKETLALLGRIEEALDELEAAEDAAQFNFLITRAMLAMRDRMDSAPPVEAEKDPPKDPFVGAPEVPGQVADARAIVIVRAVLDEKGRDTWQEKLAAATDKPSIGLALPTGDAGTTRFEVTPVADVQAFAKRLKMVVVKSVDEEKRTVTVEPE